MPPTIESLLQPQTSTIFVIYPGADTNFDDICCSTNCYYIVECYRDKLSLRIKRGKPILSEQVTIPEVEELVGEDSILCVIEEDFTIENKSYFSYSHYNGVSGYGITGQRQVYSVVGGSIERLPKAIADILFPYHSKEPVINI